MHGHVKLAPGEYLGVRGAQSVEASLVLEQGLVQAGQLVEEKNGSRKN